MISLDKLLYQFKNAKNGMILFTFEKDDELKQLVANWGPDVVSWNPPDDEEPPENPKDLWNWIWEHTEVDEDLLLLKASIIFGKPKLNIAIAKRMIYPDGTINKWAEASLSSESSHRISGR